MNVLINIFSVLIKHGQLVLGIVLMMSLSQMLMGSALRGIFRDRLSPQDYFALSAAAWTLPLSIASMFWLVWGAFLPAQTGTFFFLGLLAILSIVLFLRARPESAAGSNATLWVLIALLGAFIFLRLAFVSKVIVPLYFDSAQHYRLINNLLSSFSSSDPATWGTFTGPYYHIGFHLLTAFLTLALRANISDAILILGQIIVASLPLSLFALIKHETYSNTAGIFTVLVAAFGWYMPAYAVNWGKYPALTSLPLLTFVISLAYLTLRHKDVLTRREYVGIAVILFFGLLITILFHSRTIIVFGIFAIAWVVATAWQRMSRPLRLVSFVAVLTGIVLTILFIRTKSVFGLLFDPYWENGLTITAGIFFLSLFAAWRYPKLTLASLLVILLLLGCLLVPIRVPGYGTLTLLDRPFVEMILYLPLAFLGGAGLAGLEKSLQSLPAQWPANRVLFSQSISAVFIAMLLVQAFLHYNIYPANCCSIVGRDDLVAIDWMDKNLPSNARILISSTELRVLDTNSSQGAAGGDAGAWIQPLIGRITIPFPYQSDFSQQATFDTLCRMRTEFVYVGETGAIFNNGILSSQPDRYKIVLSMPKTKIYQLSGCPSIQ